VSAIALVTFAGSFAIVPLVGTEFIPEVDQSFVSLRLDTPVGSSLEYTDGKVREVEDVIKQFPEIVLALTTVGTQDGRNYARINLKLTDRADRQRTQKELEKAIRDALKPIPGIEVTFGYDRPIWFNMLGPDPDTLSRLTREFAQKVAKVPGIVDLETSDKAANPALSIRLYNDAASDLGITVPGRRDDTAAARRRYGELLTSTMLTLIVVPVIYTYVDQWHERRRAAKSSRPQPQGADD
jgi:hydrophobic/amphiphilic exporter-1 (mainly G- bacteria), HAE1 family